MSHGPQDVCGWDLKKKKILLRSFIFTRIPMLGRNANTLTHTVTLECTHFLFPTLAMCESRPLCGPCRQLGTLLWTLVSLNFTVFEGSHVLPFGRRGRGIEGWACLAGEDGSGSQISVN